MYSHISPWNLLPKKLIWRQLEFVKNKRVLDFGSGEGVTANHLATNNDVIAVEPNPEMIKNRLTHNQYTQITGSFEAISAMEKESFDVIVCHNVLEYVAERDRVFGEFERLLKPNGIISLVKHNRNGRIMQMVVLLNNFEHATELLSGSNGSSQQFGEISYYEDDEILKHTSSLAIDRIFGVRTFWHLQQNQDIHNDIEWQEKMLDIEMRVSLINEYRNIAFFHHVILHKSAFP